MRICILGATGLVGRETLGLVKRAWPEAELVLYASRSRDMEYEGGTYPVSAAAALEAEDAPHGDLALVALDDDFSKRYVPRLLELGYRVIDKSNTYRGDPKVPLVVGGVNHAEIDEQVRLVANPNCTTIPLCLALSPLAGAFGLRSVAVASYQAVSGAGVSALDDFLAKAKAGYAEAERLGQAFDPSGYAGNVVPHNGKTDDSGYSSEERKLMTESRKILALPELATSAQCCRVGVAVGHYENVWLELDRSAEADAIAGLWRDEGRFLRVFGGATGEGLSSLACTHDRDRALVGRLRPDARTPGGRHWCFTVAADNLRLGAATNAVRAASAWFPSADAELQA